MPLENARHLDGRETKGCKIAFGVNAMLSRNRSIRVAVSMCCCVGIASAAVLGDTINVCWDGSGNYLTIGEALDAAAPGDEIVVCDGTYSGPGNKNLRIDRPIVLRSANGPERCIIDCEGEGRAFVLTAGTLDGFTIANASMPDELGGAIQGLGILSDAPITIRNCRFIGNLAREGGAISCTGDAFTILDCTFIENLAVGCGGGAVFCDGGSPTIMSCSFIDNSAAYGGSGGRSCSYPGSGGAVYCYYADASIVDCAFTGNSARGGGAIFVDYSNAVISGCTLVSNSASRGTGGGGIFLYSGNSTIVNCSIIGNELEHNYGGSGIFATVDAQVYVRNSVIRDNRGQSGIRAGVPATYFTIVNCEISGNTSESEGGGLSLYDGMIVNSIISGNSAADNGGGINCRDTSIINCVITGNLAVNRGGGGAVYGAADIVNSILRGNVPNELPAGGPATVRYSNIVGGWTGVGNIDVDPRFVDPANGDYHLSPDSPCLDTGDDSAVPAGIWMDLDGNPRFVDHPESPITEAGSSWVDMGAYERPCTGLALLSHPQDQTVCEDDPAAFSVEAAGSGLTYQWRKDGDPIAGATSPTLVISSVAPTDVGTYDVIVRSPGNCGALSSPASLRIGPLATILTHPESRPACVGETVTFDVEADHWARRYQWRKDGIDISGATAKRLTIPQVTAADAAAYDVVLSNYCGSITSLPATLSVFSEPVRILSHPAGITHCEGAMAVFEVVTDRPPLWYQWRKDGVAIPGATQSSLTFPVFRSLAGVYDVVLIAACGTVTSEAATLRVNVEPVIVEDPVSQRICLGEPARFAVRAEGFDLTYRWRKDGVDLPLETGETLVIPETRPDDAGRYRVVVLNPCGMRTSRAATLEFRTVILVPPRGQTVCESDPFVLFVHAAGSSPSFQWRKDGVDLPGATQNIYLVTAAAPTDSGTYDVLVTLEGCTEVSDPAPVHVRDCFFPLGDLNCDAGLDGADVEPMLLALEDPAAYAAAFPGCNIFNGDMNCDGVLNGADIDAFFQCLAAGRCDCP